MKALKKAVSPPGYSFYLPGLVSIFMRIVAQEKIVLNKYVSKTETKLGEEFYTPVLFPLV